MTDDRAAAHRKIFLARPAKVEAEAEVLLYDRLLLGLSGPCTFNNEVAFAAGTVGPHNANLRVQDAPQV